MSRAIPAAKASVAALKSGAGLTVSGNALDSLLQSSTTLNWLSQLPTVEFVSAVRLGQGESASWEKDGCGLHNCVHVVFFDYESGGTVETIFNETSGQLIRQWQNLAARPAPTERIGQVAVEYAADHPEVRAVLGDLRDVESMMVPMSVWLTEGDCIRDWCVDLTYHAPDESGRIYHVVVNMRQQQVASTFYSRARADRPYTQPASEALAALQDFPFENDCHQQFGWSVCWEMTANDGMNFYDATFEGQSIFRSIKIGQVEVFYESWPGGYRDEIGFSASVPPAFGTVLTELEDGFSILQTYTEPFDWPNCVCCYRYGQKLTFYSDGSFEPTFVSHGPGCDDPSVYRPFWRIDLTLSDNPAIDTYTWAEDSWSEATEEQLVSLYQGNGPGDARIATVSGDTVYQWVPRRTDPFGVDEARLYLLQSNEEEGESAILPGSANTFQPPAQWVNDEEISGQDQVIWYVPILKTKKGGPWWCMPDPAPDFSPCESSVLILASESLDTAPDNAHPPQPTATPTVGDAETPLPGQTAIPGKIEGSDPQAIWQNAGCGACHGLEAFDSDGDLGPDLSAIGTVAGDRVDGMTAEEYLIESLLEPTAFIIVDCPQGPCQADSMPADYGARMSDTQLDILVGFLLSQGETSPEEVGSTRTSLPSAIGETSTPDPTDESDPEENGATSDDLESESESGENEADATATVFLALLGIMIVAVFGFAIWKNRAEAGKESPPTPD